MSIEDELADMVARTEAVDKAAAGIQEIPEATVGDLRKALEAYEDDERVVFLSQAGGQENITGVTKCFDHASQDYNTEVVEIF